jgi:NRPS condensation-like uncharacterized protein
MSDPAYRRIFPLYLAPFEKFMLVDDRPDSPMSFFIVMEFSGRLRRSEFEQSLRDALDRHRILQCLVEPVKQGRLCWVYHPELMPRIDWQSDLESPLECAGGERIDLMHEIGLRIWVRESKPGDTEPKTKLTLNFHHACVDGIGSHRFIGDWFAIYANHVLGEGTARLAELKPELLKMRSRRQKLSGLLDAKTLNQWSRFKYAFQFALRGATEFRAPRAAVAAGESLTPRFGIYWERLTVDEYRQLRDAAIGLGVTVNDVLVAQTFLTIKYWNESLGGKRASGRMRILMPTDLRTRGDDEMPSCNMTSYNFLTRVAKDCHDPVALVRDVRDETGQIKQRGLGAAFIDIVDAAMSRKWLLPILLGRRCLSTVVLSNVGDPTRRYTSSPPRRKGQVVIGDLELDEITGCPPLRVKTRMTVAVTTYQRRLTVGFRCDPHTFNESDVRKVMTHFMNGLRGWIQQYAPPPGDQTESNFGAHVMAED